MSRRPPLIALAMAIALLAGLAATGARVSWGSRNQQARAADGSIEVSTSVRTRSAPARRDRASVDTHTPLAASAVAFEPPAQRPIDLEVIAVATAVSGSHVVRGRSRAPPPV